MTDHTQQQQQAETGTSSRDQKEPEESEYDRWLRHQPVLFDMFSVSSQTAVRLTKCAMSNGLVPLSLLESFNDKVKVYTTTERANKLLQYLHSKARRDVEGKVFQLFIECLKEDQFYKSMWENLEKEHETLSKTTKRASAKVFQNSADDLGEILAAGPNLNAIARKLRSRSVLTEEEYSSVVDPESYYTIECLNTVLRQIGLAIKQDPKKLNVFIKILEREGPFYSSLVDSLKGSDPDLGVQTMDDNNPQEITHGAVDHETRPPVAERNQLQDYVPFLEKAAAKGTVLTRYSSLGVFGAAGTGKTSMLRLLTGQPSIKKHYSTPVLKPEEYYSTELYELPDIKGNVSLEWDSDEESDPGSSTQSTPVVQSMERRMFNTESASTEWKPVTEEVLLKHLAKCTFEQDDDDEANISSVIPTSAKQTDSTTNSDKPPNEIPPTSQSSQKPAVALNKNSKMIEKILESIESNKTLTAKPLGTTHFVSTCDSGGQAAFLDIAPALMRFNSVNLILLKLDENLEDPAQFFYCDPITGERIKNRDENREISTRALVRSFISSKSRICEPNVKRLKKVMKQYSKPKFKILGTHYDKYKDQLKSGKCQSKKKKNEILNKELSSFDDCLIHNSNKDNKVMFSLNTLARDKSAEKISAKIHKLVMNNYIQAEVPVSWYILQIAMYEVKNSKESNTTGMIHLSTLIDIGTITKLSEEDVTAALLYFHDLQVCLYFPKIVRNIVFTSPQFLFDKVSEIVAFSFGSGNEVTKLEFDNLIKYGKFKEELLKKYCNKVEFKDFSTKNFLDLMHYLFVIYLLPGTDEYFMPCILNTCTNPWADFCDSSVDRDTQPRPLAFTWYDKHLPDDCFIPNGLFPSLTNRLQADDTCFSMPRRKQQYRNKITLYTSKFGCHVTLIESTSFIAVVIRSSGSSCYVKIREVILHCIIDIVNQFGWSLGKPELCFICDICSSDEVHLCYVDENQEVLSCRENDDTPKLKNSHRAWLERIIPSSSVPLSGKTSSPNETHKDALQEIGPPQDKDLLAILSSIPVTNKLQTFCINLGLPSARCSEIFDDPTIRGDFDTQRHRVLSLWGEVKKRTWEDFVKALDTTGYHQKAEELAKRYRT